MTKGGPPAWGLGVGLQPLTVKNKFVTKSYTKPRTWTDSLDERPKRRNMDLLEIGLNVVDWIGLAQDRYRWRALVSSVMGSIKCWELPNGCTVCGLSCSTRLHRIS
jgi:hypothetical protein